MRDQSAVFENGEDLLWESWEVICITFVGHDSFLKVDRDGVVLLDCVDPVFKFDHGKAVIDRIM